MDAFEKTFLFNASMSSLKYSQASVAKIEENAFPTLNCRKRILHDLSGK
jgi:hypothetical protein